LWSMDVYPDVAVALGTIRSNSWVGRALAAASQFLVRGADVTVALGESMAGRLCEHGASRVEVIHNWADEASVIPRPSSGHPLREQWGWSNRFVVAYSGNLGLAHEFNTVLSAAGRLAETDPSVLFAFIGVGPRTSEVQQAARAIPNVEFHELVPRARLGETLTAANVHLVTLLPQMAGLVVPSKIYGVLAAGRPAVYVGPRAGEVHDIINEGLCGSSVMNGDVTGLVEAISAYARDEAKTAREGENARRFFERHFTRSMGTDAFLRLVNRTLHRDSSR
jgi:colanic acid biosynthesis glycosyl transferase WcaI